MKYSEIRYEERKWNSKVTTGLAINGRNWIPKNRVEQMWKQANISIRNLDWSEPRSAKSLFENDEWLSFRVGQRLALGRCLRYFADNGMLPIKCSNPDKKGTKKYVLSTPAHNASRKTHHAST